MSRARFLLFVQSRWADGSWAGAPKVVASKVWDWRSDPDEWRRTFPDKADRWWLVECENAAAGRSIIAGVPGHMHSGNDCNTCSAYQFNGRILAHGSRAPREAGKS